MQDGCRSAVRTRSTRNVRGYTRMQCHFHAPTITRAVGFVWFSPQQVNEGDTHDEHQGHHDQRAEDHWAKTVIEEANLCGYRRQVKSGPGK